MLNVASVESEMTFLARGLEPADLRNGVGVDEKFGQPAMGTHFGHLVPLRTSSGHNERAP